MGMMRGEFEVIDPQQAPLSEPRVVESPTPPAIAPAPVAPNTYVVTRGDTLASIARRRYGDESKWRVIAAANSGLDPRKIRPGKLLILPAEGAP